MLKKENENVDINMPRYCCVPSCKSNERMVENRPVFFHR